MNNPAHNLLADNHPLRFALQWQITSREHCPSDEAILNWAQAALLAETAGDTAVDDAESEVAAIRVVSEEEMLQANGQFRGRHKSTNVLSFPADLPPEIGLGYLGDILICATVVDAERVQQGKTIEAHWAHMVIHGMLHLQGYDHIVDEDAETMERIETEILAGLGFPDPYCPDGIKSVPGTNTTIEVKQS